MNTMLFSLQLILISNQQVQWINMSRLGRTRRTRVYDCNYDKGESYYKPVLDRLDGKTIAPREPERERIRADVDSRIRSALGDVETLHHDDIFDSRGGRVQRNRPISSALEEDEFGDEVSFVTVFLTNEHLSS